MQHTTSHTAAIQHPSPNQLYIPIGKQWYQLPEFIPSNSYSGLHICNDHLYCTATTLNTTAYPMNDDTIQTDQPNGQQPKRSPPRASTDTSDPFASEHQTSHVDVPSSTIQSRPRRQRRWPTALESYSCDW